MAVLLPSLVADHHLPQPPETVILHVTLHTNTGSSAFTSTLFSGRGPAVTCTMTWCDWRASEWEQRRHAERVASLHAMCYREGTVRSGPTQPRQRPLKQVFTG
ncbi:hypothetical protein HJFPF1_08793 [Paramyrothecium foliicola]|nr:hypothetical protein HJFPF1_08793 [Paramyrothecium foliicola]